MIYADIDTVQETGQIVLAQDVALSWRQNFYFVSVLAIVTLSIGVYFSLQGAWLVLPYAGIEVIFLMSVFVYWYRRSHKIEVIKFDRQKLVLEKGVSHPESIRDFERFWLKAELAHHAHKWYITRVILRCRNESLEIGEFLNSDDKKQLIKHIREIMPVVK